jgi:hypothetical protein
MRGEWKRFVDGLDVRPEFLHADELKTRYGVSGVPLPAVFIRDAGNMEVLAGAEAINACGTLDELKRLILSRLETF